MSDTTINYKDWPVNELKIELRIRGIKVTGSRDELVQRLRDFDVGKEVPAYGERGTVKSPDKRLTKVTPKPVPTNKAIVARSPPKRITSVSVQVVPKLTYLKMLPHELRAMTLMNLEPRDLQNACQVNEFVSICSDEYFQKEYFKHWYSRDKSLGVEYLKQFVPSEYHDDYSNILLQDINARGKLGATTLMKASFHGHKEIVPMLLDAGADKTINSQNIFGRTALINASANGQKEIVAMLLKARADPNTQNKYDGKKSLMEASLCGYKEIVEMLLKAGADQTINAQSAFGYTALLYASSNGHKEIVEILLSSGADVNVQGKYGGNTALLLASEYGYKEIVGMLLSTRVDVNAQTEHGGTALRFASNQGHKEIVAMLLAHGA